MTKGLSWKRKANIGGEEWAFIWEKKQGTIERIENVWTVVEHAVVEQESADRDEA